MKKLPLLSRSLLALGSLAMLATLKMPLWQIQLWAPQYPEGLNMKIWHNHLSGAFDIINGLNHYIGMREIKAEMFPEFGYLGILIGIFVAVGLVAAATGSRRWLLGFTLMAFGYGAAALWDFYRWGYDYGHNLNPHAAIVVPGMSYQPPVVGYKNLLNFTAYSGPDAGGWLIIAVGAVATLLTAWEFFFKNRFSKKAAVGGGARVAAAVFSTLLMSSCAGGPEPLEYGRDQCFHCKMTLTDRRFGAEVVSKKGKAFKFDDLNCLVDFLNSGQLPVGDVGQMLVVDFSKPGHLISAETAFYVKSHDLKSPMAGNTAAFQTRDALDKVMKNTGGEPLDWLFVRSNL